MRFPESYPEQSPAFGRLSKKPRRRLPRRPTHNGSTSKITASSPGTQIGKWELFSRLRYLHKPVELYVVPDIAHGSHALQNPTQLLSLQQRALDWWCFWLKDEVDTDPRKSEQYERWQVLRELRDRQLHGHKGDRFISPSACVSRSASAAWEDALAREAFDFENECF